MTTLPRPLQSGCRGWASDELTALEARAATHENTQPAGYKPGWPTSSAALCHGTASPEQDQPPHQDHRQDRRSSFGAPARRPRPYHLTTRSNRPVARKAHCVGASPRPTLATIGRERAHVRSPWPITLREAQFADLQIPIAEIGTPDSCAVCACRRAQIALLWLWAGPLRSQRRRELASVDRDRGR